MSTTHRNHSEPHPINLHLQFLRRTAATPGTFTVRDVKLGSRISNIHITLSQQQENGKSRDAVQGYVTMSNIATEVGVTLSTDYQLRPSPLPVDLQACLSTGEDQNWTLMPTHAFPAFRHAAKHIQMYLAKPERVPQDWPKGMLDQWVRIVPGDQPGKWTNDSLGFAVDMFPQLVEVILDVERQRNGQPTPDARRVPKGRYWYPTMALNLDIKKLLPPGGVEWLFVRALAKVVKNGVLDHDITILDAAGEIVASSTNCSLVVGADRNTAGRKERKQESKI